MTKHMTTQDRIVHDKSSIFDKVISAARYVSSGQSARIQAILEELNRIHLPETPEETQLVERLAIAMAKQYETEAAYDERLRWQRANAAELFERLHHERFTEDLIAWRDNPTRMIETFGKTWHSAMFLKEMWHAVLDAISNGLGVTYDQGKDMATALGGDWRADRIDIHRGYIFSLILANDANPAALAKRWVNDSRAGRKDTGPLEDDMDRAQWFLATAPDPATARGELGSLAERHFQVWKSESERLRELHFAELARCIEVAPGQPIGNSDDIRSTRLCQRDVTRAENQANKLERRLIALKKSRQKRDPRSPITADEERSARSAAKAEPPAPKPTETAMRICSIPAETPQPVSPQAPDCSTDKRRAPNSSDVDPASHSSTGDAAERASRASGTARRPDSHGIARAARARTQPARVRRNDRTSASRSQKLPARGFRPGPTSPHAPQTAMDRSCDF